MERFDTFTFLGNVITAKLSWSANISAVNKKTQNCLLFLRVLRENKISEKLLVTFYCSTIKSILIYCIKGWFSNCRLADGERPQRGP